MKTIDLVLPLMTFFQSEIGLLFYYAFTVKILIVYVNMIKSLQSERINFSGF